MTAPGTAWRAWDRFWFAPVSATGVGVQRATLGLVLLVTHLALYPERVPLFDAQGPLPPEAAASFLPWPRWAVLDGLSGEPAITAAWWACVPVYVAVILGIGGRLPLLAALLVQVAIYHRNPFMQNGGDRVLRFATAYLLTVPVTRAFSVDAWLRRADAPASHLVSGVARRLVQVQLAVIYVHSGYVKAQGATWHQGTALFQALSDGQYQRLPALTEWLLDTPWVHPVLQLATWTTLAWEAGFAILVLWRPTRLLAMAVGVAVHLGIFGLMNVGTFSFAMLWAYPFLLRHEWADRLLSRLR